jgi:hypothetical protein
MNVAESFPLTGYGVTYATFDEGILRFESELAVHLDDGSLLTLPLPTRQDERLAIQHELCVRSGWCQVA